MAVPGPDGHIVPGLVLPGAAWKPGFSSVRGGWDRAALEVLRQPKADPGYHQLFFPLPCLDYLSLHLGFS